MDKEIIEGKTEEIEFTTTDWNNGMIVTRIIPLKRTWERIYIESSLN